MDHRYHEFEFTVEGMAEAQASELLNLILAFVEAHGYELGGGYRATSDADYPWFLPYIERITAWLVNAWKAVRHG